MDPAVVIVVQIKPLDDGVSLQFKIDREPELNKEMILEYLKFVVNCLENGGQPCDI